MIEKTLTTPHGPVFIRPGQGADAPAYRKLRLEALRLHPEAFGADYDHSARQPMTFWTDRLRSTRYHQRGRHPLLHPLRFYRVRRRTTGDPA